MGRRIDITGQTFGRLTAQSCTSVQRWGKTRVLWLCQCICGNTCEATIDQLKSCLIQSCGCFHRERATTANTRHGKSGTVVYLAWKNMIQRCTNPRNRMFHCYGARGVTICSAWRTSFETFQRDMGEPPALHYSLDRINNNQGYEPGNCRWATRQQQNNNTRRNHYITFQDRTMTLAEWALHVHISRKLLEARITRLGWPVEKALTTPPRSREQSAKRTFIPK